MENIEDKAINRRYDVADKVSFETSLKFAILTGIVRNGDVVNEDNKQYIVNLTKTNDSKIGIKLIPYKQAC